MLTTSVKTIVPGEITIRLEFASTSDKRGRITYVNYHGEDDDRNFVRVSFDPCLFEAEDVESYPNVIEATFVTLPDEPEENKEGSV